MKGGAIGSVLGRPTPAQQQGACNCGQPQAQPTPVPQPTAIGINPHAANGGAIYSRPQPIPQWNPQSQSAGITPEYEAGGWGRVFNRMQPQPQAQIFQRTPQTISGGMMGNLSGMFRNMGLFG